MTAARTAGAALFGAFVGAWIGRAIFVWLLSVPGPWEWLLVAVTAVIGAVLCVLGSAEDAAKQSPPDALPSDAGH